jgi:hypothetical protein
MNIHFHIEGKTYQELTNVEIKLEQAHNEHGYPTDRPKKGFIKMTIPTDTTKMEDRHPYEYFLEWMMDSKLRKDGTIHYFSGDDDLNPAFSINFQEAYCVDYRFYADATSTNESAHEEIMISAKILEVGNAKMDKTKLWKD